MTRALNDSERAVFEAVRDPEYTNFALLNAEMDGRDVAVIVAVTTDGDQYDLGPVAVLVDDEMRDRLTCDGQALSDG